VEVDVDVTDDTCARQKEEQCCESDSDQEPTVPSKESVETSQEESDAAFAVAAQAQEFHDAATEAVAAVTGVAPSYPYEQALHQLKEMGFDDDEGWLTHLLHAKGGDIGRVLDAIQPQSKKM
jgi:sequestosome 1